MCFQSEAHMLQLKMAEYRQIRDEKQNCVCGICLIGIYEKTLEIDTYMYTYMLTKLFQNLRILSEWLKMFPGD